MTGKPKRNAATNSIGSRLRAPAHPHRALALSAAALAALCLIATQAFASKEVVDYFGNSGSLGGEFSVPRDIAVNSTGNGGVPAGTTYVVDVGNNRIQRFSPTGAFVSAWGADVVKAGGAGDLGGAAAKDFEICTVATECKAGVAAGGNGTQAGNGALAAPQSVAVDQDTGSVYVSDRGNRRINVYTDAGAFIRSFGWEVARAGEPGDVPGTDEVQTIALSAGAAGTFKLNFGGSTSPISTEASAVEVQSALEALPGIGAGDVAVSGGSAGGPWTVEFSGDLADRNVAEIGVDNSGLSAPVGAVFTCSSSTSATATSFQWLTSGAPSTGPGATTDTYTAVAADAGKPIQCQVVKTNANGGSAQASLSALFVNPYPAVAPPVTDRPQLGPLNRVDVGVRFTCSFGPSETVTVGYQWYRNGVAIPGATGAGYTIQPGDVPGVIQCAKIVANVGGTILVISKNRLSEGGIGSPDPPGGDGDTNNPADGVVNVSVSGGPQATVTTDVEGAPGGYEVCEGAVAACRSGIGGPGAGQVGETSTDGALGLAVSEPLGKLFLADTGNRRVNTYNLDGANPASFGSSAEFGADQPRAIAVDSRGIVYASDSEDGGEIERYDTIDANSTGVGFLDPIAATDSGTPGPLLASANATATAGLEVHPDSDGGVPNDASDEDVLYVLRDPSSGNTVVQQFGPTNDPALAGAPAATDDTHGDGAGFGSVTSLGFDDAAGRLLISATNDVSGIGSGHRVYILDDSSAPGATLDPITYVDAHSAGLSGTIDPGGALTGYHFEYVDDAEFGANGFTNADRVPALHELRVNGSVPVAVELRTPDHLIPGTTYHARLVAKQVFGPSQAISAPQTFASEGSSPTLTATATVSIDEATLRAAINPENEAVTDYHFEWGTDATYGNTTPVGNLSQGTDPVAVSADLDGLTPAQTYHYRLRATNGTGETVGPDQTFTTIAQQPGFGPQREYELVSKYPSGGIPVIPHPGPSNVAVSEDGNRVFLSTLQQPFPGSELVPPFDHDHNGSSTWKYGSVRGSDGWDFFEYGLAQTLDSASPSADGTKYLFMTTANYDEYGRLDPDDQNSSLDVYQRQPDGSLLWISRDPRIPVGTPQTVSGDARTLQPAFSNMSADGSVVVFRSNRQLLDADTDGGTSTYTWENGQLSLGSPDSLSGKSGAPLRDYSGQVNFFTSTGRLTPDSGAGPGAPDLYARDVDTDEVRDVTPRLDGIDDPGVDPAVADQARVLGIAASSEAVGRVYFVADAQYDTAPNSQGDLPSPAGRNLYTAKLDAIDDPIVLRFVTALGADDANAWGGNVSGKQGKSASTGPDGAVLGFGSEENLTGQDLGGTTQMFVYDAEADTLACASCPSDGSQPADDVFVRLDIVGNRTLWWQKSETPMRWVSSEGVVFFDTKTALLDADQNIVDDVYEYRGGELRLVSSGTDTRTSLFEDASVDGSTVIINTQEALVPKDEEPGVNKLYAARVGGGFPYTPPEPGCDLSAGACEGAGTNPPDQPGAGTAVFSGPGNTKTSPKKRCPRGKRKVRRKGKVRCVKRRHKRARHHRKHRRVAKYNRRANR